MASPRYHGDAAKVAGTCYNVIVTQYTPNDVLLADRHIADGEAHIVRQESLLTQMSMSGLDTTTAHALLKQLNASLTEHRKHRTAISAALEEARRPKDRAADGR